MVTILPDFISGSGLIISILGHKTFNLLSRLTYNVYLFHMILITIDIGSIRQYRYLNDVNILSNGIKNIVFATLLALLISVIIELPLLNIEKAFFNNKKSRAIGYIKKL